MLERKTAARSMGAASSRMLPARCAAAKNAGRRAESPEARAATHPALRAINAARPHCGSAQSSAWNEPVTAIRSVPRAASNENVPVATEGRTSVKITSPMSAT